MISSWNVDSSWTLFLDRDGVINERIWGGYVLNYNDFIFRNGTIEAIRIFSSIFQHIFVVTNQQCVAKELISHKELENIHNLMIGEINKNNGRITEVFSAIEYKNQEPFRRKPNINMAYEIQAKYSEVNFTKSIMIGDTDSDIDFGKKLGMKTIRILSDEKETIHADLKITNLLEFSKLLNY